MTRPLTALLLNTSANAASLITTALEHFGYSLSLLRVETSAAMRKALVGGSTVDIVLCDDTVVGISAPDALAILKESFPSLPCIIVSSAISEDSAGMWMKAGARDFVMNSNLTRLGPAIARELNTAACYQRLLDSASQAKATLVQQQTELTTILDASQTLIWYKDRANKILRINKPAAASLNRTTAEIEGHSTLEFYPEPDATKYHLDDLEVIDSRQAKLAIIEPYQIASGETRWVQTDKIPYCDELGNIIGVIVFSLDITELKEAQAALERLAAKEQKARLEAERLSRVKDEFLVTLSHELRTPLMPILGWLDLLSNSPMDEISVQKALSIIERNALIELHLIDDLLDVSRIISGKLSIANLAVDLLQVVKDAIDTLHIAAEAKNLDLQIELDQQPCGLVGDAKRLQQLVWNLLGNAIKFTPQGGRITVRLTCQGHCAVIAIADTGIGIAPDFLPHVFERFRQADSSTTRTYGGLGLGLALVFYIAEAHGGSVSVTSPGEGLGSTFTVLLPLATERFSPPPNTFAKDSSRVPIATQQNRA